MSEFYSDPYTSEVIYVACLNTLLSAYIIPLSNSIQQTKSVGDGEDCSILLLTFGTDVLELLSCHRAILNELQASSHDTPGTAKSFLSALKKAVSAMRVAYQTYVAHLASNMDLVQCARSSVSRTVWCGSYPFLARGTLANNLLDLGLDEKHVTIFSENSNITLDALAVLPIQRIARYSVYLKEWINTCMDRAMKDTASEVLTKIQNICSLAEGVQSSFEQVRKLSNLERTIGIDASGASRLISEGDVEFVCSRKKQSGKVVLLSKCLLVVYTCDKNDEYSKKRVERIPLFSVLSVRRAIPEETCPFGFEISYATQSHWPWKRGDSNRRFVAVVPSEIDAILWVRDITQAIDDLTRLE